MQLTLIPNGTAQVRTPNATTVNWLAEHFPDPADQREYARQKCVEAIGSALQRALNAAKLNRVALAEKLGKSKSQISRILGGAHNMTLHTLGDILWACDVEVDDLVLSPLGVVNVSLSDASVWQDVVIANGVSDRAS